MKKTLTMLVTFLVSVLVGMIVAGAGMAHIPSKHPEGSLGAPKLHWLASVRQETNRVADSKCRARPHRAVVPARLVPEFARTFTIRIDLSRLAVYRTMRSACVPWYITAQIRAANHLAANSQGDPWPNCPDPGPRDNQGPGHTWTDTVACENGGSWLDSPGFYRCGLQFHPMWERVYGRLCP